MLWPEEELIPQIVLYCAKLSAPDQGLWSLNNSQRHEQSADSEFIYSSTLPFSRGDQATIGKTTKLKHSLKQDRHVSNLMLKQAFAL
jgi:hypothetical protein